MAITTYDVLENRYAPDNRSVEVLHPRKSLYAIVKELIEKDGNKNKSAVHYLIAMAEADHYISGLLLKYGAEQVVRDYYHAERRSFVNTPTNPLLDEVRTAERAESKRKRRAFWDRYTLFGQAHLRTSKRPDLSESVSARRIQAEGNLRCAAFEEDIMNRLSSDTIMVHRQFREKEIIAMAEKHHVI